MTTTNIEQRERAEDVFFGQFVIIAARYFLIAGLVAVLLSSVDGASQMAMLAVPVTLFLGMNFFLHGRYLMERPANVTLIALSSIVDLVLVTLLVTIGVVADRGYGSPFFVLYYPLILAFAFVVPRRMEIGYTALAVLLHAGSVVMLTPGVLTDMADLKRLVLRLVTLAACGGLANYYWRTLRARRRAAAAIPIA